MKLLPFLVILCLIPPPNAHAQDTWIGKAVFTKDGAILRDDEGQPLGPEAGSPDRNQYRFFKVAKSKGDELWLERQAPQINGWVRQTDVIPDSQAEQYLTDQIRTKPTAIRFFFRGTQRDDRKAYDLANADFSEAIRLDPKFARAFVWRGKVWMRQNDFNKAIAEYNEALSLEPSLVTALQARAYVFCVKTQDYDTAIADCNEILRREPKNVWALDCRGQSWFAKKQYDKAIDDATMALRLNPKSAETLHLRGTAWLEKSEFDKAIADLSEALRLDPKRTNSREGRAFAWFSKGEFDKALAEYNEAILNGPVNAEMLLSRAAAWAGKGDYVNAIDDCDESIRLKPKANAFKNRATAWAFLGEFDRALADYSEALRLDPKRADILVLRGRTWSVKKNYAKALDDYAQSSALDPNHTAPLVLKAWLLATCPDPKFRDGKKAVEIAEQATVLSNSHDSGSLQALAAAYAETGDFAKAVERQLKANALLTDPTAKKQGEARLKLYKDKKPFRDDQ